MDLKSYNPKFENSSLDDEKITEIPIKRFDQFTPRQKTSKKKPGKLLFILAIIFVIVIVILFSLFSKSTPKPAKTNSTTAKTQNKTSQLSYNSTTSSLDFSYPSNLVVNDNNSGLITISSPISQLPQTSNSNISGKVIITINQQTTIPATFGNYSLAVDNSAKINYTSPTQYQRNQTYLTEVQYPATLASNGLDAVYVTGDFGYTKNQVIPLTDIAKLNPLIMITFVSCKDSTCSSTSPLTVSSSFVTNQLFSNQAVGIIKSLQLN